MAGMLIAGTSSDAGKSMVVTGLCRAFSLRGIRVAPFKAQNMSNNSMVCRDGAEIGRAQYLQAQAAGVEPSSLHNPVLLKPGSDRQAFIVLRGRPAGQLWAGEYATGRSLLAQTAFETYEELAGTVDLVVCEGAGSPAEINLRAGDYVNMGLARKFDLPVAVVGDIDRGGILASLYGTWALLDTHDRALIQAFIINKFRGDVSVLTPGLDSISELTGVPFLGVVPWLEDLWLDSEDSLTIDRWRAKGSHEDPARRLSVAVVRFPRASNATDMDALASEAGIDLRVTADIDVCREADLLVLPGTRATVADLQWLRDSGLADVVIDRARRCRPILGICGGYQMLAAFIHDTIESRSGRVDGLALIDREVAFHEQKVLGRPSGTWQGHAVDGYEIHHGVIAGDETFPGGCMQDAIWGTMWHGIFENDEFRRAWLSTIAQQSGSAWQPDPHSITYRQRREAMIDLLAQALERDLDLDRLLGMALDPS
ncbi:MAG: cobyric acid synthase [Candidatus Nanopelagicales bacterium]